MFIIELIRSVLLGIIEGITEWLPISSTGHLILFNSFFGGGGFTSEPLYVYVIQLGAILAVVTVFWNKLWPFSRNKTALQKNQTWNLWFKVIVGILPAVIIGLLLDDVMESWESDGIIGAMLILYGIAFILIERKKRTPSVSKLSQITYRTALLIGLFQCLAIVPGTSRSGATILGAILIGCSRPIAAEFSFFLSIPIMFGISFLKIVKNLGQLASLGNVVLLLVGMAVAYIVSMFAVRFLMNYVKKHSFSSFGVYRIILGVIVILRFAILVL